MNAIRRIKQIIDHKSMSVRAFERLIGVSHNSIQAAIKRDGGVKEETLNKVLQVAPEINPVWLLTGEGSMLLEEEKKEVVTTEHKSPKDDGVVKRGLTDAEKGIISNAFLLYPKAVLEIPAVKKWHEAALLKCENKLMREFATLRQPEELP